MSDREGFFEGSQPFEQDENGLRSVKYTRLKIDSAGRVVITAEMRAAMLVKPGDIVTADVADGEFRIVSPEVALKRVQAFARKWKAEHPGESVVDELIAERREEARRELEEANEWRKAHGLPPLE
jgi:bifunctional DNA-binding transcriptional regulator/antitoxin component of YhaV-PrlF toxin-antitoxin module